MFGSMPVPAVAASISGRKRGHPRRRRDHAARALGEQHMGAAGDRPGPKVGLAGGNVGERVAGLCGPDPGSGSGGSLHRPGDRHDHARSPARGERPRAAQRSRPSARVAVSGVGFRNLTAAPCLLLFAFSAILVRSQAGPAPRSGLIYAPPRRPRALKILTSSGGIGASVCKSWFLVVTVIWVGRRPCTSPPLGHDVAVNDNFARRGYDEEMGVESLVPIATLEERIAAWTEVSGRRSSPTSAISAIRRSCTSMVGDFRPRHDRALRRAARRAVLDDRPGARRLHADQQRRRQPQRDVRDRRHRHRHPPRQARDDGRVRHARTSTSRRGGSRSSTRAAATA